MNSDSRPFASLASHSSTAWLTKLAQTEASKKEQSQEAAPQHKSQGLHQAQWLGSTTCCSSASTRSPLQTNLLPERHQGTPPWGDYIGDYRYGKHLTPYLLDYDMAPSAGMEPAMGERMGSSLEQPEATRTQERAKRRHHSLRWKKAAIALALAWAILKGQIWSRSGQVWGTGQDQAATHRPGKEWQCGSGKPHIESTLRRERRIRTEGRAKTPQSEEESKKKSRLPEEATGKEGLRVQGMENQFEDPHPGGDQAARRSHTQAPSRLGQGRGRHQKDWGRPVRHLHAFGAGNFGGRSGKENGNGHQDDGDVHCARTSHSAMPRPGICQPADTGTAAHCDIVQSECNISSNDRIAESGSFEVPHAEHETLWWQSTIRSLSHTRSQGEAETYFPGCGRRLDPRAPGEASCAHRLRAGCSTQLGTHGGHSRGYGELGPMKQYEQTSHGPICAIFQGSIKSSGTHAFVHPSGDNSSRTLGEHPGDNPLFSHLGSNLEVEPMVALLSQLPFTCTSIWRGPGFFLEFLYGISSQVHFHFHSLSATLQIVVALALMLIGWSLLLFAAYFPWWHQKYYQLAKIHKRRYFFLLRDGETRQTSHKKRLAFSEFRRNRIFKFFLALSIFPADLAMQVGGRGSLDLDIFAPPSHVGSGDEHSDDQQFYREILVHRLDNEPSSFRFPIATPLWQLRSAIGTHLRLTMNRNHWDNFNIYPVQPQPQKASDLLSIHMIAELPNDRSYSESLILVEKKELRPAQRSDLATWRVRNALTREELIYDVHAEHECGRQLETCLLYVLGDLWPPQDQQIKIIPLGALVKIIFSLDEDTDQLGTQESSSECPSRSRSRMSRQSDSSFNEDASYSGDSASLMQTSVDQYLLRGLHDEVFRILSGRAGYLGFQHGRGFGFSLWPLQGPGHPSMNELRVWADHRQPSWTQLCCAHAQAQGYGIDREAQHWEFFLVMPGPPSTRMTPNNINLLRTHTALRDQDVPLLVDVYDEFWLRRTSIIVQSVTTVIELASSLYGTRTLDVNFFIYQLIWNTESGAIVLHDYDAISLPQGSFVELSRHSRDSNALDCMLLQLAATIQRVRQDRASVPCGLTLDLPSNVWRKEGTAPAGIVSDSFDHPVGLRPPQFLEHTTQILYWNHSHQLSPHREPTIGLRPPGNPPVLWSNFDLNEMDIIVKHKDIWEVLDDNQSRLRAIPTPSRNPKKIICLEEMIPGANQKTSHHQIDFQVDDNFFWEIFQFQDNDMLYQDTTTLMELHESTQDWLLQNPKIHFESWDPADTEEILVYTDGSFQSSSGKAAWAFAIVAVQQTKPSLVGYLGAMVALAPQDDHFVGTKSAGASQAETEALYWASFWLCRFAISSAWRGRITFRWDAMVSGAKAQGFAMVHNIDRQGATGHRMRCLQHLLGTLMTDQCVQHAHVYAHNGEPLNELVDMISKTALQKEWANPLPGPSVALIESECPQAFEMMWFHFADREHDPQWPKYDNGLLTWSTSSTPFEPSPEVKSTIRQSMLGFQHDTLKTTKKIHYELYLASYNTMTMSDQHGSTLHADRGRAALLRRQLNERAVTVAAFQEARTNNGTYHSSTHFRFASGKDQHGQGGIEIWFAREWPFGWSDDHTSYFFKEHAFHVIAATPSILAIHYTSSEINIVFVGAHGPHEGHNDQRKDEWWELLDNTLQTAPKDASHVLLCDANARIGNIPDPSFGGLSEDKENGNGHRLRRCAHMHNLWAPATFEAHHWGDLHTWEHPSGHGRARLDYILVPQTWKNATIWSEVNSDITTALGVPDHTCTTLWITWTHEVQVNKCKRQTFNRVQATDPRNAQVLTQIIEDLPKVPWTTDASEHAAIFVQHIHKQLVHHFPNHASRSAPPFASDLTTLIYKRLTAARRALKQVNTQLPFKYKAMCFYGWRHGFAQPEHKKELHIFKLKIGQLRQRIQIEALALKNALRTDRKHFVDEITSQAQHLNVSEIYKALRPLMPKRTSTAQRPLPVIRQEDGSFTTSREEFDQRWTSYFAALEAGREIDFDDYLKETFSQQASQIRPDNWSPQELPQLAWLERGAQQFRRGKMPGFDLIPGEIFKAHPGRTAKAMLPLLWKFTLKQQEAVSFKGGKLIALFKQKGPMDECTSYRSILLTATLGKLLRAATRPLINQPYVQNSDELQLAGKKGNLVTFGSQMARSFLNIHKQRGWSAAIVFGDVKSAFYMTLRQLAVGAVCCYEDAAKIAKFFSLDESVMQELHKALEGRPAQRELGGSDLQTGLLHQSLSGTWFSMNATTMTATFRGSRPGDSWADVCFNILFAAVVRQICSELSDEGWCLELPEPMILCPHHVTTTPAGIKVPHVTWADDIAVLVSIRDASLANRAVAAATTSLLKALRRHAMEATVGEGKTAALVLPRGPNAVKVRRLLFSSKQATLPILMEHACVQLPLVSRYRHLGGVIAANGGLMPELKTRAARARAGFWKVASVLRAKNIELAKRVILFQSTVLSIWTWGMGSWAWLSKKEFGFFEKVTWQLYALMLPVKPQADGTFHRRTHHELQLQLGLPHPIDLLQEARLRNIGHMTKAAPMPVWAAYVHDDDARKAAKSALQWFWQAMSNDCGLPHFDDWEPWRQLMLQSPPHWKRLVKASTLRHTRHQVSSMAVLQWHWRILGVLREFGDVTPPSRSKTTNVSEYCMLCGMSFSSRKAWFLHSHVTHGYRSPHGRAASGSACPVCSKQYPSNRCLINHLRYSARCRTYFELHADFLSHGDQLDHHPQRPWLGTALPPERAPEPVDFEREALLQQLQLCWDSTISALDYERLPGTIEQIKQCLTCVLPFPKICQIWQDWLSETTDEGPLDHLPRLQAVQVEIERWLLQFTSFSTAEDQAEDLWWQIVSDEASRSTFRPPHIHPRTWEYLPTECFYLHFFSGRRRAGDLQSMLEECELPPSTILHVVSLDVTICSQRCDLRQPDQQLRWVLLIREHKVWGATAGPPCETWSRARSQNMPDSMCKPPRPLRQATCPWGKREVSKKEHTQLFIGNDLMLFSVLCMLLVAIHDGFTALEHPQSPSQYGDFGPHASVWETALIQWLMATNLFVMLMVNQGHFSAKSVKPTTLLVAGVQSTTLVRLERALRTSSLPVKGAIGLENGVWRTAALKEYPAPFNRLIAQCFQVWLHQRSDRPSRESLSDDTWVKELCVSLAECPQAMSYGPDFFQGGLPVEFNSSARR